MQIDALTSAARSIPYHAVPLPPGTPWWMAWHLEPALTLGLLGAGWLYAVSWGMTARRHARSPSDAAAEPPSGTSFPSAAGAEPLGRTPSLPPAVKRDLRPLAYFLGLACLAAAMLGPLDVLNEASFSLHMLQHLVLVQLAAPLLVLGRPWQVVLQAVPSRATGWVTHALLRPRAGRLVWRAVSHPLTAFVAFNASLALWHLPRFYVAALENPALHALEHQSFLVSALLFWWLVLTPAPHRPPISHTARLLMCFGTALVGDVVAAGLSLSTRVLYAPYAGHPGLGGRTALADQQLGGIVMWVSGGMFYLLMFWVLYQIFETSIGADPAAPEGSAIGAG